MLYVARVNMTTQRSSDDGQRFVLVVAEVSLVLLEDARDLVDVLRVNGSNLFLRRIRSVLCLDGLSIHEAVTFSFLRRFRHTPELPPEDKNGNAERLAEKVDDAFGRVPHAGKATAP
jgi:hypothetical protein